MTIKAVLIVSCFVAALAIPVPQDILNYDALDHKHSQSGEAGSAVKGSYSHTDAEGKTYTVNYEADENGYRATGEHLPVAPPVPVVSVPASVELKTDTTAAAAAVAIQPAVIHTIRLLPSAFPYAYNHLTLPSPFVYSYGIPHGYAYTF